MICLTARVTAGIAAAIILIASFLDSQFTFCSIGSTRSALRAKARKARGSHEQVSDIEYIIPRVSCIIITLSVNIQPQVTHT